MLHLSERPPTVDGSLPSREGSELGLAAVQEQAASQLEEALRILLGILSTREKRNALVTLKSGNAQVLIDFMYSSLSLSHYPESTHPSLRKHTLIALRQLCERSGLYPRWFALNDIVTNPSDVNGGGFCDIYEGRWSNGQKLCLKVVRLYSKGDINQLLKHFSREAILWSQLDHPNIAPFYGLYYLNPARTRVCLVSPWQDNGNIVAYLQKNPQAPRKHLCFNVVSGLGYLHDQSIIHGDLKGLNVLITNTGAACITDFGLSVIKSSKTLGVTATKFRTEGRTDRWASPELLDDDSRPSYASDIWAFGCVCYEVLTRSLPFHDCSKDIQIIRKLLQGDLPARLDEGTTSPVSVDRIDEPMKILIKKCWSLQPENRPSAAQILEGLEQQVFAEIDSTEQLDSSIQSSTEKQQGLTVSDPTKQLDERKSDHSEIYDRQRFQDAMNRYSGVLSDLFLVQATLKTCGLLDLVVNMEGVESGQGDHLIGNSIIPQQNTPTVECLMCSGEYPMDLVVHTEKCEHLFCRGCLRDHVRAKISEGLNPIFCPLCTMDGRWQHGVIDEGVIRGIGLPQEDYEAFKNTISVPLQPRIPPSIQPGPPPAPLRVNKPDWHRILGPKYHDSRTSVAPTPLAASDDRFRQAIEDMRYPNPVGNAQAASQPAPEILESLDLMEMMRTNPPPMNMYQPLPTTTRMSAETGLWGAPSDYGGPARTSPNVNAQHTPVLQHPQAHARQQALKAPVASDNYQRQLPLYPLNNPAIPNNPGGGIGVAGRGEAGQGQGQGGQGRQRMIAIQDYKMTDNEQLPVWDSNEQTSDWFYRNPLSALFSGQTPNTLSEWNGHLSTSR